MTGKQEPLDFDAQGNTFVWSERGPVSCIRLLGDVAAYIQCRYNTIRA
jgi:hypothetical protein